MYPILKAHNLRRTIVFAATLLAAILSTPAQDSGTSQQKVSDNKIDQTMRSAARVNPSTLAVEISIPLASFPGRKGNAVPVSLNYSSKVWGMASSFTYFYVTGNNRQYVTQLRPEFAKRSAAGWTTNLNIPVIEERLELFDPVGRPFSLPTSDDLFSSFINDLLHREQNSNGGTCDECDYVDGYCPPYCPICREYCNSPLPGPGGGGSGGGPPSGSPTPTPTPNMPPTPAPYPTPSPTPTPNPFPVPYPTPVEQPAPMQIYYIKKVHVRMVDGATHEFRASDAVLPFCVVYQPGGGCEQQVPDFMGTFLSVDGTGMRLERDSSGSILYLPDGSRYTFSSTSTSAYERTVMYPATEFRDANGNRTSFQEEFVDEGIVRTITDTLGRTFQNPLPENLRFQEQTEGVQLVKLPSVDRGERTYELRWEHLKPPGCETDPNCQTPGGALEFPAQPLHFYTANTCFGSSYTNLPTPDPSQPGVTYTQNLFPNNGIGLRACNPFEIDSSNNIVAHRFNPVVLSEIQLPDGQRYSFKYNQYGEITKVAYPTGAVERFEHARVLPLSQAGSPAYDQANRGVTNRRIYAENGMLKESWQYAIEADPAGYRVRITAPRHDNPAAAGSISVRQLLADSSSGVRFGFQVPTTGMAIDESSFDENNILRSRVLSEYIDTPPRAGGHPSAARDARLRRTLSVTFEAGSDNALATLAVNDYDDAGDPDPSFFSHLNIKRKKTFHYAVLNASEVDNEQLSWSTIQAWFPPDKLASISETDYAYDAAYRNHGFAALPVRTRVLNPADPDPGNPLATTEIIYDNTLPMSSPGYGYFMRTYGTGNSMDCSADPEHPRICWENPGGPAADIDLAYRGLPTTARTWHAEAGSWIETHTRYDQFGNIVTTRDPLGSETTSEYSPDYKYAYLTKVITPPPDPTNTHGTDQASTVETSYDLATGLPLTVKDDFGQISRTEYDSLLRPVRVFGENFNLAETQTMYGSPNLNGQFTADQRFVKVRRQLDQINWDETTNWFDELARTTKTQSKDSAGDVFTETAFDALGREARVTNPYRAGETVLWSKTRYDPAGRAVERYAPIELVNLANAQSLGLTSFRISTVPGFVGTVQTTTDSSGRRDRTITNALGQVLRVDEPVALGGNEDADLGSLATSHQPTFYSYSPHGNLVHVKQDAQDRYFLYDSLGRLIRVRQPEQEINRSLTLADPVTGNSDWTAGFSYDVLGNVLAATDANGVTVTNTYDRVNRVKTRNYTGETAGQTTPPANFYYDGKGLDSIQTPHNFAKGKLTKVENSVSQTRYTVFDNFGRLKEMEQRTPVGSQTIQSAPARISKFTYNLSGGLLEEEYPSGRIVRNTLDSDGRLTTVTSRKAGTQVFSPYASNFAYNASGEIYQVRLGNGRWETTKFNSRLQVTELALGASASNTGLWKTNYEYGELTGDGTVDPAKNTGDIAKQTLSFPGMTHPFVQIYRYDPLSRLKEAKETVNGGQTWRQTIGYDRYGNRNTFSQDIAGTVTNSTPAVDSNTNRFESDQGFVYDRNGNMVADIDPASSLARTFVFNGENKQTHVQRDGTTIGRYYYDGEGRRVKKETTTETTVFVYSADKLVAEYSTQSSPQASVNYAMTDHLGSLRVITDALGRVRSRRDFMPFGEEVPAGVGGRAPAEGYSTTDGVRQRFTGYQKDSETALDFAEARMYESRHGRFTAVDPLLASGKTAQPQSFNRYAYVENRPLIMIDPTGEVGDFYTFNGKWIRSDGKKDKKVYVSLQVITPGSKGKPTSIDKLLPVTIDQFRKMAHTILNEGTSNDPTEYRFFAHAANNEGVAISKKMFDVLMSGWSSVPASGKTELSDRNKSARANFARAGVIDVLSGGKDPTGGARYFDGTDFLAWGLRSPYKGGAPHAKFRQYSEIVIDQQIYQDYARSQALKYPGGTVSYKVGGVRQTYNLPAPVFQNQAYWSTDKNGRTTFRYTTRYTSKQRLVATGARGQSLFWKVE